MFSTRFKSLKMTLDLISIWRCIRNHSPNLFGWRTTIGCMIYTFQVEAILPTVRNLKRILNALSFTTGETQAGPRAPGGVELVVEWMCSNLMESRQTTSVAEFSPVRIVGFSILPVCLSSNFFSLVQILDATWFLRYLCCEQVRGA